MARWLFITVGIAALLAATAIALGTAWLNTFIHSPAFRREVETRAGRTLGGPVRVETIDLGFFGVKLRNVSAQVSRANGQGSFSAQVKNVDCHYALGDLLRRRLTLTEIVNESRRLKPEWKDTPQTVLISIIEDFLGQHDAFDQFVLTRVDSEQRALLRQIASISS